MTRAVGDRDRIRLHTVEYESPDSSGAQHSCTSAAPAGTQHSNSTLSCVGAQQRCKQWAAHSSMASSSSSSSMLGIQCLRVLNRQGVCGRSAWPPSRACRCMLTASLATCKPCCAPSPRPAMPHVLKDEVSAHRTCMHTAPHHPASSRRLLTAAHSTHTACLLCCAGATCANGENNTFDEDTCLVLPEWAIRSGPRGTVYFDPEKVRLTGQLSFDMCLSKGGASRRGR